MFRNHGIHWNFQFENALNDDIYKPLPSNSKAQERKINEGNCGKYQFEEF